MSKENLIAMKIIYDDEIANESHLHEGRLGHIFFEKPIFCILRFPGMFLTYKCNCIMIFKNLDFFIFFHSFNGQN